MAPAIVMQGCSNGVIENCSIQGFDVAIDISDSSDIRVSNTNFGNSATGLRARRVSRLTANNNTHRIEPSPEIRYVSHLPMVWRRWELSPSTYQALYEK